MDAYDINQIRFLICKFFYVWYFQLNSLVLWKLKYVVDQNSCDQVIDKLREVVVLVS